MPLFTINMLVILMISMLGCGAQDGKSKYEAAKLQAENKSTELVEILRPVKALERGDTSVLTKDPEALKRISEKMDIKTIQKLSNEVNQAMRRVADLRPEGYKDDYDQWTKKIKEKLDSVK